MNYIWHILILIEIYLILTMSLNLVVGYAGMFSLCHAAFYGIGAYVSALVMTGGLLLPANRELFVVVPAAVAASALFSLAVSGPFFKLRGDYLALASVGLQTVTFVLIYNLTWLTNGAFGIADIPEPVVFGRPVSEYGAALSGSHTFSFFLFSSVFTGACVWLLYKVSVSPFGRVLKALREDELSATSLGKNVKRLKITAFTLATGFAALAGVLFTSYAHFIDPTSFTLMESVFILSILIVGGAGNFAGPVAGTVLLILLPELLRYLPVPESVAPSLRQIIDGALMILVVVFRPRGLAGEYRFG